jgi:hypothetical protein
MNKLMGMREALEHPQIFGSILPGETWAAWRILLIAIAGEELASTERVIFKDLTGRDKEPGEWAEEFWAIVGRRGGKTRAIAVLAAYIAALVDFSDVLAPGERASVLIMSASLWQANKALQYLDGIFAGVPALAKLVDGRTADTIALSTKIDIECRPASFRTIRGGTACAIIADEVCFWRNEATANPDTEILNGARPSLATTGGLLAAISSPYARRGEAFETWKRHFGPTGDARIVVAKAPSKTMNPGLKQSIIDRAYERDPTSAGAEYGGEWRTDIEAFISREVVDGATIPGRHELAPVRLQSYVAFVDPSGGSADAMTLAIAHTEGEIVVLDLLREVKPPFSPDAVCQAFAADLKRFWLTNCTGDRYGGEWPVERFAAHGIEYVTSERSKSEIYRELLPILNAHRAELLDNPILSAQLIGLERRTARGGRDSIDHAPNSHDDLINSAAGAIVLAIGDDDDNVWAKLAAKTKREEAAACTLRAPPSQVNAGREMLARHFAQLQFRPTPNASATSKHMLGHKLIKGIPLASEM